MQRSNWLIKFIPSGFLAIFLMVVYLSTMAPGLTWANFGVDGGDLITASAAGGIAHPTGYPLYLLLARLFQFIPIGSLAYRTNLMSAFASVSAALLVYGLVIRSLPSSSLSQNWMAGLASGMAFGLAPLIWSQAVITEVYALHVLCVVGILYLLIVNPGSAHFNQKQQDCLVGIVFGLALGNHLTTVFLLPLILLSTIHRNPLHNQAGHWTNKWVLNGRSLLRRILWSGVGLLVYIILPLRALAHPAVNWGNPVTLDGFVWLVSGKIYQNLLFTLNFSSILERSQVEISLLLVQFGIAGLSFGLIGLIVYFKPNRLYYYLLWITFISAAFALGYGTSDAIMYLIPAFLCFAIWIGIGLGEVMKVSSKRLKHSGIVVGFLLIIILLIQAWTNLPQVDASQDSRAEIFGRNALALAPEHALVFTKGDRAIFTLWYFQYALQERPDIMIVASDLLGFKWYIQTLHFTYPDLNLPDLAPFPETLVASNPGRPVCYIEYLQAPEINCLSARNSGVP